MHSCRPCGNRNGAAPLGIAERVIDEITQYALDQTDVAEHEREIRADRSLELDLSSGRRKLEILRHILHEVAERERLRGDGDLA